MTALSLDLAPTLLEFAGADRPDDVHGRSLVQVLQGEEVSPRNSFLIEYYSDRVYRRIRNMGYKALRTDRWKYIRYTELDGMDELYDLNASPYEMNNLINDPASQATLARLQAELNRSLPAGIQRSNETGRRQ